MSIICFEKKWPSWSTDSVQFDYSHPLSCCMVACWYAGSPFKDLYSLKSYIPGGTYTGVRKITPIGLAHSTGSGAGALIGGPITTLTQKTVLVYGAINSNFSSTVGMGNGAWVTSWTTGSANYNIDKAKTKATIGGSQYWGPNTVYVYGTPVWTGFVYDGTTIRVIYNLEYNDTACSGTFTAGHVLQIGSSAYGSGSSNSDLQLVMVWDRCLDWSHILSIQADPYQLFRPQNPK